MKKIYVCSILMVISISLLLAYYHHKAQEFYGLFTLGTEMQSRDVFTDKMKTQVQQNINCLSQEAIEYLEIDTSFISDESYLMWFGKILNELPVTKNNHYAEINDTIHYGVFINTKKPIELQFNLVHIEGKIFLDEIVNLCMLYAHINEYFAIQKEREKCA